MLVHGQLPEGAILRDIVEHRDSRGVLAQLFRADWGGLQVPRQWNYVRTNANTLRGVHVHRDHEDYLIVLDGVMRVGLYDLRTVSATSGKSALVDLSGEKLAAIFVPKGVMHGFYFAGPTSYVYGLTNCWTPADDLGCRWDEPALGLPWGAVDPILSARDAAAPSLDALRRRIADEGWIP
jgi:dTDP-4-dehydrorhamnose 3,5-epimerase